MRGEVASTLDQFQVWPLPRALYFEMIIGHRWPVDSGEHIHTPTTHRIVECFGDVRHAVARVCSVPPSRAQLERLASN